MTLPPLRFEYAQSPASIADPSLSGSWTWVDCSSVVRLSDGPGWNRGRQDERQAVGPGACSWVVDDPSGDWAPDGSGVVGIGTPIRVRYEVSTGVYVGLWSGFVAGLRSAWVNGVLPVCHVQGIDLMGWLARQETSVPAAAASGIASLSPVVWWPCDDGAGALTLRQIGSDAGMPALEARHVDDGGGTVQTLVDGVPALRLDPAGRFRGWEFVSAGGATVTEDRTYCVHFRVSKRPDNGERAFLCGWGDASHYVSLVVDDGGRLVVDTKLSGAGVSWSGWPDVSDNRWHHAALVLDEVGTTNDYGLTLYLDGEIAPRNGGWAVGSPFADTQTDLYFVSVSSGYPTDGMWRGDVAHICAFSAKLTQDQVRTAAGPGCSSGLDAGEAVTALLAPTGVVPTTTGTFAATLTALDASGSMLSAVQAAAAAERGVVHALAAGGLEVQARSVRRSASTVLTLDAADVATDLAPQSDEQSVTNDVTVTGVGSSIVARRVDQTSLGLYGRRAQSMSLPLGTVAACDDHAAWMVSAWSTPTVRVGSALVQATVKAATVTTSTLLGVDLGDLVVIDGLPGTPSSLPLFVEGVAMRAGLAGLDVTFNLSPQVEPDLIDYAAQGTLLAWWDARFPAGTSTQVADQTLIRTMVDLTGNGHDATAAGSVNLLDERLSTFEDAPDVYTWPGVWDDQYNGYPAWSSYSRQSATKHDGTYGGLATWAVGSKANLTGIGIWPYDPSKVCQGIIPGAAYTVSMWVLVSGAVHAAVGHYTDTGTEHTGGGGWERLYWHTYADTSDTGLMGHGIAGNLKIGLVPTQDGYGLAYFDSVMVEEGHVVPGTFNNDDPASLRPRLRYGAPGSSPTLETGLVGHVLPMASGVTAAAPCVLYVVARPDALGKYLTASSTTVGGFGIITSGGVEKWRYRYSSTKYVDSSEIADPTGQLCVVTVQIAAGGAVSFRHNGADAGGGTNSGILGLNFDRLVGTNAAPWDGGIGAVLAYEGAHDAATVARIERALALMWGVTLA